MTKRSFIIVTLFLGLALLSAYRIDAEPARVSVTGARVITTERAAALVRAGGLASLQEAYFQKGYLFARLETRVVAGPDSTLMVIVDEGEVARVGDVRIQGAIARQPADVRASLGLETGAAFVPEALTRRIESLLTDYDRDGHPFVQLWIDSLGVDSANARVNLSLFVVEGSHREIKEIMVEGLKKTRPELAIRIAGIEAGVPYSARQLEDAYIRLTASGVFSDVEYPTVQLSSDGVGVDAVLKVTERARSHSFTAALGYAAAEQDQKRELSGLVSLKLNNVGGTLKDFDVYWNNDGKERSETRIEYRDRFFLGRRLGFGLRLQQVGQDTLYTWQSAGVKVGRPVGRLFGSLMNLSLGAHADRNVFSRGDLLRSWRYRAVAGLSVLRGNDQRRRGLADVGVDFTFARKDNTFRDAVTQSLNQFIFGVDADVVLPLSSILLAHFAGAYNGLQSNEALVPLSEQFYIGGARTLRGYKENQFHGRRAGYLRNELLVGPTRWENFYVFADIGYLLQEEPTPEGIVASSNLFRAGYGFGVRTGSRLGNVDLSFAVGDEFSLEQTKVHVLLEQNF